MWFAMSSKVLHAFLVVYHGCSLGPVAPLVLKTQATQFPGPLQNAKMIQLLAVDLARDSRLINDRVTISFVTGVRSYRDATVFFWRRHWFQCLTKTLEATIQVISWFFHRVSQTSRKLAICDVKNGFSVKCRSIWYLPHPPKPTLYQFSVLIGRQIILQNKIWQTNVS